MPEEKLMNEVLTRLTRIETKIDSYKPQLDDHETRLRDLESKNGKKWDSLWLAVVTTAVAGIVGVVIGKII